MPGRFPLFALLNNPIDLTLFESNLQYIRELHVVNGRMVDLGTGVAHGRSGWFRVDLDDFVGENSNGGETVGSMTCRGPFGSFFGSSFLNSVAVEIDFSTSSSCFCFPDTIGLSSKIHLIHKVPLLVPSLVEACFKSTVPEKLQIPSFVCGHHSVENRRTLSRSAGSVNISKSMEVDGGGAADGRTGMESEGWVGET
jgi:hypothetical protein